MTSRRASFAAVLVAAVTLAACGGDDDDDGAPPASQPGSVEQPSATDAASAPADGDGPQATVSPDLPPELAGEIGPVEVRGQSLPELGDHEVADDPARGMTAPVLIGENFDGETVRVDPAVDGPTLLVFLAHWCPHCNREVPRINELRDDGRLPEGLNIVGVSTGIDPRRPNWPPSEWFQDVDWTYPVIADGVDLDKGTFIAADAYGLDSFPFLVLVDGDGKVVARDSGEISPDDLVQLITDNLAADASAG